MGSEQVLLLPTQGRPSRLLHIKPAEKRHRAGGSTPTKLGRGAPRESQIGVLSDTRLLALN